MHTFFQFVELRICFSNLFQCYPFGLTHCWLSTFQCQAVFPSNKKEKTKILKTISYHLRDPRILCICSHFCGFKDTGNAKQLRIAKKLSSGRRLGSSYLLPFDPFEYMQIRSGCELHRCFSINCLLDFSLYSIAVIYSYGPEKNICICMELPWRRQVLRLQSFVF